jgi:outer membrane protein assembly factor BamD
LISIPRRFVRRTARACLVLLSIAGCGAHVLPEVHSEAERLALARRLMDEHHNAEAVELLKTYVTLGAGTSEVDHAIELLGEAYLRTKEWPLAAEEFERLLRDYPESDSAGSASFGLAEALFGQARPPDFDQEYTTKAVDQWQTYLRDYDGHWRNGEAKLRLESARRQLATKLLNNGRLYFKLGLAGPARIYYRRIEQEFADTGLLGDAWMGLAQCDAKEGKRADAIEHLKRVEAEFPGQAIALKAQRELARLRD